MIESDNSPARLDAMAVLETRPGCRPWCFAVWCRGAQSVIELPAGALAHTGTLPGDRLDLNAETVPPEKRTMYSNHSAGEQSTVCPSKENPTI